MHNPSPCVEWAEKLACKPADLSPDERAALQAHLATCPGCAATYADYQMLIARLRALPRPAPRALPPLASQIVTAPDGQDQTNSRRNSASGAVLTLPGAEPPLPPTPVPLPPTRRRNWPQRLSAIAAALLLTVLVGSLALLLTNHPQQPSAASPGPFKLHSGWTQLVEYNGTGSQTFTGQNIKIPRLWGYASICAGSGSLGIDLIGGTDTNSFDNSIVRGPCDFPHPSNASPATVSFDGVASDSAASPSYTTVKITADAKTRWFFQIARAIKQPTLTLGQEWDHMFGLGGEGNGEIAANTATAPYKTWGFVSICFGTGSWTLQLPPNVGKITMPACDGQAHLSKAHYSPAITAQMVQVTAPGDMLWDIEIFGCANEQKCGGS